MINNGRNHKSTPPGVRKYARGRWGPFHTDMAAESWNTMAHRFYSAERSFLDLEPGPHLSLGAVWANPPWEHHPGIGAFVTQWLDLLRYPGVVDRTVWLLPTRTGQKWFTQITRRCAMIPIQGRLRFDPPPGHPKGQGGFEDTAFFVHGDPALEPGRIYWGPTARKGDFEC